MLGFNQNKTNKTKYFLLLQTVASIIIKGVVLEKFLILTYYQTHNFFRKNSEIYDKMDIWNAEIEQKNF